jgi:hypothetical protein
MIRAMANSWFTTTPSLEAITAAGGHAARAMLHTLNLPGRQRRSELTDVEIPARHSDQYDYHRDTGHCVRAGLFVARCPDLATGKPPPRAARTRGPVEPRALPPRHAGRNHSHSH